MTRTRTQKARAAKQAAIRGTTTAQKPPRLNANHLPVNRPRFPQLQQAAYVPPGQREQSREADADERLGLPHDERMSMLHKILDLRHAGSLSTAAVANARVEPGLYQPLPLQQQNAAPNLVKRSFTDLEEAKRYIKVLEAHVEGLHAWLEDYIHPGELDLGLLMVIVARTVGCLRSEHKADIGRFTASASAYVVW